MDGLENRLEVYHTDLLLLGDNNADFTVAFAFLQTEEHVEEIDSFYNWRSIILKGDWYGERTPGIWKNFDNTGFCPRIRVKAENEDDMNEYD